MKDKAPKKSKKMIAENPQFSGKTKAHKYCQNNDEKSISEVNGKDSSVNEDSFKMKSSEASDKVFEEKPLTEEEMMNSEDYIFCYVDGVMHFVKLPESD